MAVICHIEPSFANSLFILVELLVEVEEMNPLQVQSTEVGCIGKARLSFQ